MLKFKSTGQIIQWTDLPHFFPNTSFPQDRSRIDILAFGLEEVPEPVVVPSIITQEELDAQIAAQLALEKKEFLNSVISAVQKRLDTFAHTRNYDNILSACTYATSTVPKFKTEGQYCVDLRDSTWSTLYTLLAEVEAGTKPMPATVEEVISLLPTMEWPV